MGKVKLHGLSPVEDWIERVHELEIERDDFQTKLEAAEALLAAANHIRFPLPSGVDHFTSVTRYDRNPNQPFFGKWMAANGEYQHNSAIEAFAAISGEGITND